MKQNDNTKALRPGLKDIWNARLVSGASFCKGSVPYSPTTASMLPKRVIRWSEALESDGDPDAWVSCYEPESSYDGPHGLWNDPDSCLKVLRKFGGFIAPDYRKDPFTPDPVRLWNIYRSHALAYWFGTQGISVVNSAWYSYDCGDIDFSCIEENSTVAVDTSCTDPHNRLDMWNLEMTLSHIDQLLQPLNVIVNGPVYRCVTEILGIEVNIYHIDPLSGELVQVTDEDRVERNAAIDFTAPFIPGKNVGGIELETPMQDLDELISADDSELIICNQDCRCYEIAGKIQLWFARSNDRLFQIGIKPGYSGNVLGYEDIWKVTEEEFLNKHGSEFEWLEDDEVYESSSLGMDIAFDNDDGTASWCAALIAPVTGDLTERDLSDWTQPDGERDSDWMSVVPHDRFTEGAEWDRGFPVCPTTSDEIPTEVITWSVAKGCHGAEHRNAFVCFYEDDWKFDGRHGVWNDPDHALEVLSCFRGVIVPDFSTHQDFPDAIKQYNTYRMRALGFWLGSRGIRVINNVRWGDRNTWWYSFAGIEQHSTVAIGTLGGGPRRRTNTKRFTEGLNALVDELEPDTIIIYGGAAHECFKQLKEKGIKVVSFESQTAKAFAD